MSDWMQCSWRHNLKHVRKIDLDRRGVATIIGKAFHSAIEARVEGREPDREAIRKVVAEELELVTDEAEKAKFDVDANVERAIVMSVEALEFLNTKFPGWKLHKAEEDLYEAIALDVAQHTDVKFKGFIDLIIEIPHKKNGTEFWIIDWKTASRPWGRDKLTDPKVTYQLSLYKNFWAAKHNMPHDRVKCGYIVAVKSAKPGKLCNLIPVSVGPTTSKRTLTVLNNFVHSVKRGMALKNKSEKNCKWCEYKGTPHCP
jgi:ATP-dependent exoDNAse (exonuclease V) beta subunit